MPGLRLNPCVGRKARIAVFFDQGLGRGAVYSAIEL